MNILILEDDEVRIKEFKYRFIGNSVIIVNHANDAINLLSKNEYDLITLDHDLDHMSFVNPDTYNNTGTKVVKWLSENLDNPNYGKLFNIHSHNIGAAYRMRDILTGANYTCMLGSFWQIAGQAFCYMSNDNDDQAFSNSVTQSIVDSLMDKKVEKDVIQKVEWLGYRADNLFKTLVYGKETKNNS